MKSSCLYRIELSSRYVKFDVEALKSIACKALGAERCTEFAYYTEGPKSLPSLDLFVLTHFDMVVNLEL